MFRNTPLIPWIPLPFLTSSYLSLFPCPYFFSLLYPVYTTTLLSSLQFHPLPIFVPNRSRCGHFLLLLPSTPFFKPHLKDFCRMRLCLLWCGFLYKRQLCSHFHHWQSNFNDFGASNYIRDVWFFNLSTWSADSLNFFVSSLHLSSISLIFLTLLLIILLNLHWSIG